MGTSRKRSAGPFVIPRQFGYHSSPKKNDVQPTPHVFVSYATCHGERCTEEARLRAWGIENKVKKTVDDLQHQIQLMQAIFDSISDGVIVADEQGSLTFNQSAERIIGGKVDTVLKHGTEEYSIFYPDKVTPIPTEELPLVRALRGEATDEMEMFIRTATKPEGVYISTNGRPIASPGTTARGGVIVFRDVTERVPSASPKKVRRWLLCRPPKGSFPFGLKLCL